MGFLIVNKGKKNSKLKVSIINKKNNISNNNSLVNLVKLTKEDVEAMRCSAYEYAI